MRPTVAADAVPSRRAASAQAGTSRSAGNSTSWRCPRLPSSNGFDHLAPSLALAVIDLAEIRQLRLDHLATGVRVDPHISRAERAFHSRIVAVFLIRKTALVACLLNTGGPLLYSRELLSALFKGSSS
jgi:hypothetical protein